MRIYENGVFRDATEKEISEMAELNTEKLTQTQQTDPLTEMATAMSTATTLAQVRTAAKAFLDATVESEV